MIKQGIQLHRFLNLRSQMLSSQIVGDNQKVVFGVMKENNKVATMRLNKPSALNALDYDMLLAIKNQIPKWENDQVSAVILSGQGGKALCAGGDVKSLYFAKTQPSQEYPESLLKTFFHQEYEVDYKLATMKPILIALMDGIVMGGGVGISVHAPIRIATEHSVFAMPEAKLGLFTDVGGGYFLSRLKGNLGMFLGLTGFRLKGADLYHAGIADYYVQREKLNQIIEEIGQSVTQQNQQQIVRDIISKYIPKDVFLFMSYFFKIPKFSLSNEDLLTIHETFQDNTYSALVNNLKTNPNQTFSSKQLDIINSSCPISVRVIFEQLKRGKNLDLRENLKMDYRIVLRFMQGQDFFEGVKSILVDKNHKPQWTFKDTEKIPEEEVLKYLSPLKDELLI